MFYKIFFLNMQLDAANMPATIKKYIQFNVLHENPKSFYTLLHCMQEQTCLIEIFLKMQPYFP